MNTALLLIIVALQSFAIYYLVRTSRNLGSKATRHQNQLLSELRQIKSSSGGILLNQLLIPSGSQFKPVSWDHVISLTSHPARFSTLAKALESLMNQRLIPKKIYLNIASTDMDKLPTEVKKLASDGKIEIISCDDLGPGKKLIPTLKLEKTLPIIVVDDDLFFEGDLTLKLMIQHHLTPECVVAARVHKVKIKEGNKLASYDKWEKNYSHSDGPSSELFATSGAGTLYKASFFHPDVLDESTYKDLSFHTDDLWWFVQSKRVGTLTKRLPGLNNLIYIDNTQEDGLWRTGNQDRNDPNLQSLIKKYLI